jgi:hypothetical protein
LWALVEVAVTHYQNSSTLFAEERGYLELADRYCSQMHHKNQAEAWQKEIKLILKTRPEGLEPSTFGFGDQRSTN